MKREERFDKDPTW